MLGYPLSAMPKKYYARGCYFSLSGHSPFSHLIYPIPSNNMLGIHLTVDISGKAKFGPDIEWITEIDYTVRIYTFYFLQYLIGILYKSANLSSLFS